jgi:hypothetical protein
MLLYRENPNSIKKRNINFRVREFKYKFSKSIELSLSFLFLLKLLLIFVVKLITPLYIYIYFRKTNYGIKNNDKFYGNVSLKEQLVLVEKMSENYLNEDSDRL